MVTLTFQYIERNVLFSLDTNTKREGEILVIPVLHTHTHARDIFLPAQIIQYTEQV